MNGGLGLSFVHVFVPEDFPGFQIKAEDSPKMIGVGDLESVAAEVESLLRALGFAFIDYGGKEDLLAPYDGRGPTPSGDVGFPGHVFSGGPGVGNVGIFGDTTGLGTAKGGPVFLGGEREKEDEREDQNAHHDKTVLKRESFLEPEGEQRMLKNAGLPSRACARGGSSS